MSEFKGTPGPCTGKDVHICQQDKAGLQIGFLMTSSDERREEGAANAHLIAAAPELLEALQAIMDSNYVLPKEVVTLANAAIAKALGQ